MKASGFSLLLNPGYVLFDSVKKSKPRPTVARRPVVAVIRATHSNR